MFAWRQLLAGAVAGGCLVVSLGVSVESWQLIIAHLQGVYTAAEWVRSQLSSALETLLGQSNAWGPLPPLWHLTILRHAILSSAVRVCFRCFACRPCTDFA